MTTHSATFLAALVAIQWGLQQASRHRGQRFLPRDRLIFFAANSIKLFEGGWFPLLLAAAVAFLMLTWRRGQRLAEKARPLCAARTRIAGHRADIRGAARFG
jgi:KUP system potassium uptake protein